MQKFSAIFLLVNSNFLMMADHNHVGKGDHEIYTQAFEEAVGNGGDMMEASNHQSTPTFGSQGNSSSEGIEQGFSHSIYHTMEPRFGSSLVNR